MRREFATRGCIPFWEGSTDGQASQGIKFGAFYQNGTKHTFAVLGDRLQACNGTKCIEGTALQGGHFELETPLGTYWLHIKKVTTPTASGAIKFWSAPKTGIETYEVGLTGVGGTSSSTDPICHYPPDRNESGEPGKTWSRPLDVIFFTGDRYDEQSRVIIDPVKNQNWFNIACAGGAVFKLFINRYTTASALPTAVPKREQRQALLKAYRSFICPAGYAFTQPHTKLHFQDEAKSLSALVGNEQAFEARWTENGAICMDKHRLGSTYLADIEAACGVIPACNGSVTTPTFGDGVWFVTAVP